MTTVEYLFSIATVADLDHRLTCIKAELLYGAKFDIKFAFVTNLIYRISTVEIEHTKGIIVVPKYHKFNVIKNKKRLLDSVNACGLQVGDIIITE